jgi:hypothetical protein
MVDWFLGCRWFCHGFRIMNKIVSEIDHLHVPTKYCSKKRAIFFYNVVRLICGLFEACLMNKKNDLVFFVLSRECTFHKAGQELSKPIETNI